MKHAEDIFDDSNVRMVKVKNCVKLNVRAEPSTKSTVVCEVNKGDILMVSDSLGEWSLVFTEMSMFGYVMSIFLEDI